MAKSLQEDEGGLGGPKFIPPLYQQRYATVIEIARRLKTKKVVDIGCAECKLLRQLKREPYIEELVGVDIDSILLNMHQTIVSPLTTDYLFPREKPLHFVLMHGSIAEPDMRLMNFDLLACIEVIEHLDPPVLESVPYTIFGVLCPKMVVMTTPNSEFNVLFPRFTGFRHPDHRFEWSRMQFQSWCNRIAGCYGYDVEYSGVGKPPLGKEAVGFCSQIAIFTLSSSHHKSSTHDPIATPYTVLSESHYPYQSNQTSPEEKLCSEVEYYLGVLLRQRMDSISEGQGDTKCVYIKLEDVLRFPRVKTFCSSVSEIQCSLKHSTSIHLDATGTYAVFPCEPLNSDLTSSDDESDENTKPSQISSTQFTNKFAETEEDWDNV